MNMSRMEIERALVALGAKVEPVSGTGEIMYSHPLMPRRLRVNGRRKDTPKAAISFLRQLRARLAEVGDLEDPT